MRQWLTNGQVIRILADGLAKIESRQVQLTTRIEALRGAIQEIEANPWMDKRRLWMNYGALLDERPEAKP